MHTESSVIISPPVLIYIGMGIVIARILLEKTSLRGMHWLAWLQFLVNAGSIVLLWPLVLFIDKLQGWLKPDPEGDPHDLAGNFDASTDMAAGPRRQISNMRGISTALASLVNSYKRLAGYESPVCVFWVRINLFALIRVPRASAPESTRLELRCPDPARNAPGAHVSDRVLNAHRLEWEDFRLEVTDWEPEKCLPNY